MRNEISDAIKVEREIGLKPVNSEIYMKNSKIVPLKVYCFLKWDDLWLQLHYLKHLSRSTLDIFGILSGTLPPRNNHPAQKAGTPPLKGGEPERFVLFTFRDAAGDLHSAKNRKQ
jgi:hypothetical protein